MMARIPISIHILFLIWVRGH